MLKGFDGKTISRSSDGYVVIAILVISAAAMLVAAGMIFFGNFLTISEQVRKVTHQHSVKIALTNFRTVLKKDVVLITAKEPDNGSSFNCIATNSWCADTWTPFRKIQLTATQTYYDSLPTTSGFDQTGQVCSSFPSNTCFLRIKNLEWSPKCTGGCVGEEIRIRFQLEVTPELRNQFNLQNYPNTVESS